MKKENDSKLYFGDFAMLWCGAAISIAEIMTGGLIAPLGFKWGLIAIICGHVIGTAILVIGGIIGSREKIPAITSTRISFGVYGSYIFSVLNILQLIGWTAVMINTAAQSLNLISVKMWDINNVALWSFVIGLLVAIWIIAGMVGFKKINTIAVALLFILTIVMGWVIFKNNNIYHSTAQNSISFGSALELVIVMPLSWLPMISDYTRFAVNGKQASAGSFLGYFIGSSWMFIIGLGAAILSKNSDPSAIMLASNLGIIAFAIVVLSTVTTTFMDVYSAGISFLNIVPKFNEKIAAVVITIIGTVISLAFSTDIYMNFLYAIGSVFAPLFAVLLADYFLKKKRKIEDTLLLNVGSMLVWIVGIIVYYIFIKIDFVLGATVPSMILTALIYIIGWNYINRWKIVR